MSSVPQNRHHREGGFTLLEIMISMAIMVMIAFAIFQATTETYRLRAALSTEGDFYNGIRLASMIIQRDISLIYSPINMKPPAKPTPVAPNGTPAGTTDTTQLGDDLAQSFKFWSPAIEATGLRPTHFLGTDTKVSFVSLSHMRVYKDSPESEFAKVTYELEPAKATEEGTPEGMVLVKIEDPVAFNKDDRRDTAARNYKVLYGIKKLSFVYYQREGDTWKTSRSWDSDKEETKNKYPDIIEVQLEVVGPNRMNFTGSFKFRPEMPLNGLYPTT